MIFPFFMFINSSFFVIFFLFPFFQNFWILFSFPPPDPPMRQTPSPRPPASDPPPPDPPSAGPPSSAGPPGGLWGFTRQPENSKRAHLSVPALQTPPKFHEKTPRERERKRAKMGAGEGKKSAKFWASRLRAPTLRAPTLQSPTLWAPTLRAPTLGALTFSRSGPHPSAPPTLQAQTPPGPTLRAPTLLAEALRASTFSGFGLLRSSFFHVAHLFFFCAFLIDSISCHFFEIFTVFVFHGFSKNLLFLTHFFIFQVGEEGGKGKPKPKTSLGRGLPLPPPNLKLVWGLGERRGLLPPQKQTPYLETGVGGSVGIDPLRKHNQDRCK